MEQNQTTQILVFSVPELVELIISYLINSSPQTIFNIASVSKWHNSVVSSEKLWKPFGIIAKDNLKSEWFRIQLFLAEKEEAMLEKRLEDIKRIKWNAIKAKKEFEPEEDKPFKFIPKGPKDLEKAVRKIFKGKEASKLIYWLKSLTKSLNVSLSFVPKTNKVAYLVESGFIPKLIELLRHKKEDVRVLAFAVLAHVASSAEYSHVTYHDEFAEMLVQRLGQEKEKFTNEKLVLPFSLVFVAKKPEGAMLLLKHEAVPKLVVPDIFFGDNNDLIQCSLLLIVSHIVEQKPDYFVPYFDDFLKLMSIELERTNTSKEHYTLQIMSEYLSVIRTSDHVETIIKKLFVPILIKCCQQHGLPNINAALGLLAEIVGNGTKQHIDHLIECGLLEITEHLLRQGYTQLNIHNVDPVLQHAARVVYRVMKHYKRTQEIKLFKLVITRLLELDDQNADVPLFYTTAAKILLLTCQASSTAERAEYVQQGIFNNIMALLNLNSTHILTAAISSLNLFFEDSPDLIMQAKDQGIVDKLNRILGQYNDNSELQTAVNKCLTYFQS